MPLGRNIVSIAHKLSNGARITSSSIHMRNLCGIEWIPCHLSLPTHVELVTSVPSKIFKRVQNPSINWELRHVKPLKLT